MALDWRYMRLTSMKIRKSIGLICALFLFLLNTQSASAAGNVNGRWVNPITDICWKCLFPLTIGSIPVTPVLPDTSVNQNTSLSSTLPDTPNPSSPIQLCPMGIGYRVGVAIGFWEPFAMTDVTATPGNMVNMGGMSVSVSKLKTGTGTNESNTVGQSFYQVHWYKYPALSWLNIITSLACKQTGDMDIGYMTELDPMWSDSSLSALINPEAILFANPVSQAACAADSVSALVSKPIDALFWCAGSQGSMYPFNGFVSNSFSPLSVSVLLSERMDFKLHREGLIQDSIGKDKAVCFTYPTVIMPKSRYRYQMVNMIPDSGSCHPFGRSTLSWGYLHTLPMMKRNFGYVIWRKRNCVV